MSTLEPYSNTFSHSEIDSYNSCKRKHYYGYGLRIQSPDVSDALERGTRGHAGAELYYQEQKDSQEAGTWDPGISTTEVKEKILAKLAEDAAVDGGEQVVLVQRLMDNLDLSQHRILAVEFEEEVEIEPGINALVILDLIVESPEGEIWVYDVKFSAQFFGDKFIEVLPQLPRYVAAMRHSGKPVDRAGYIQVKTKPSKADIASGLSENLVRVQEVDVSEQKVARALDEFVFAAKNIKTLKEEATRADTLAYWNLDATRVGSQFVCNMCPFALICTSELKDEPETSQMIVDAFYEPKKKREDR